MKNFAFALFICVLATLAALGVPPVSGQGVERRLQPSVDILTVNTTSACTTESTLEEDLWTYTLPAGTLNTNGKAVRVTAVFDYLNNGNNKTSKIYFGGSVIGGRGAAADNNSFILIEASVIRTGAATQKAAGGTSVSTTATRLVTVVTPSETLADAITIKATGQSGTGTLNDVCFVSAIVEILQ